MIDIHCHVIWGVDDGARTLEDSIEMLRMAAAHGTSDIVATPHKDSTWVYDRATIEARLNELNAAGTGVSLHLACDFHLNLENFEAALANPPEFTVNGSRYLMVELPDPVLPVGMGQALSRLMEAGILPVITHPERNRALQRDEKLLGEWVAAGCSAQITGQSLEGFFGRSAEDLGWRFLEQGLAHFVASDGHDLVRRPPVLDRAYRLVASRFDAATAERLFVVNPRSVLSGVALAPIQRRKTGFRFFR